MVRVGRRQADDDTDRHHAIQTVYQPGSFTPLLRIETEMANRRRRGTGAWRRCCKRTRCDATGGAVGDAGEAGAGTARGAVSAESEAWLAQCGLTAERWPRSWRRNTSRSGNFIFTTRPPGTAAGAHQPGRGNGVAGEYDEWGNLLGETSAQHLQQRTVCRDSSMMRSRGCITTVTVL